MSEKTPMPADFDELHSEFQRMIRPVNFITAQFGVARWAYRRGQLEEYERAMQRIRDEIAGPMVLR